MSKVLIITKDFPPNISKVGFMIRMTELANFFIHHNFEVYTLSCERSKEWDDLLYLDSKVKNNKIKGISSYYNVPKEEANYFELFYKGVRKFFDIILKNFLIDIEQLDVNKYYLKAKTIIENEKINNVIISLPPNSLSIVGIKLKNEFGDKINLITDYRDSWTLRNLFISNRNQKMISRSREIEQKLIDVSDQLIFVSSGMEKVYKDNFDIDSCLVIENGFIDYDYNDVSNESDLAQKIRNKDKLLIGYFGTGSANGKMPYKDFGNLISLLKKDSNKQINKKICLVLQGHITLPDSMPDNLEVIQSPPVSNEKVRTNMELVDVGLVVHSEKYDAPQVMGGKVYDYIASEIPIWLLIPDNAYSLLEFADRHKKPFVSNIFDQKSIEKTLKHIIKLWENETLSNYSLDNSEINIYSRESQYKKILSILDN